MLVNNEEDFMPNKPASQNLIDQMKRQISIKSNGSGSKKSKHRNRSQTLGPTNNNLSGSRTNSVGPVNADNPGMYQASGQPQKDKSIHSLHAKRSTDEKEMTRSFMSSNYVKDSGVKDLNVFDCEPLPDIRETSNRDSSADNSGDHNDAKPRKNDRYKTNQVYKQKLNGTGRAPKNMIFREMNRSNTSSDMDGVQSLSSGYTEHSTIKETSDFRGYAIGFACGFFLSFFGIFAVLLCSKRKRSCDGAVHGALASGILLLIVFNSYFVALIQGMSQSTEHMEHKSCAANQGINSPHLTHSEQFGYEKKIFPGNDNALNTSDNKVIYPGYNHPNQEGFNQPSGYGNVIYNGQKAQTKDQSVQTEGNFGDSNNPRNKAGLDNGKVVEQVTESHLRDQSNTSFTDPNAGGFLQPSDSSLKTVTPDIQTLDHRIRLL